MQKEERYNLTDAAGDGISVSARQPEVNRKHTEEIHEIISKEPLWIVRWGIVLVAAILLLVLSIAATIRYPDTLKLPLRMSSNTISPHQPIALVQVTQEHFSAIKIGQKAIVHLTAFPNDYYGRLSGSIISISEEPDRRGLFTVQLKLDTTTLKPPFKLQSWMIGKAEIITNDVTLLQRIYRNLVKI